SRDWSSDVCSSDVHSCAGPTDMHDLLDYHEALHTLITTHQPIGSLERVPLSQLCGRVLAQAVQVRFDVPAFDNSAMDGYAIHGNNHREWKIVDRIAAGDNAD